MASKKSDVTSGRSVPRWITRFPDFARTLELAKQRAHEEHWGFVPDEVFLATGALRAGLDHILDQLQETRVLARPEPRIADEDRALTLAEYVEKQRGRAESRRKAAAHAE